MFMENKIPGGHSPTAATLVRAVVVIGVGLLVIYGAYFWLIRRIVVGPGEVLVLLKKDGGRSLPGDQVVIPRPPDAAHDAQAYAAWQEQYGDCNGICEQVYLPGTYFGFSPFDYEREVMKTTEVPSGKVGIVVKKFGSAAPSEGIIADPAHDERGPLAIILQPGQYPQYANPYAYEVKLVDPVVVEPGNRGVVTLMSGKPAVNPDSYLVNVGEQGTQSSTEPEGFLFVNPFLKRITRSVCEASNFK